ncbi:DUF2310 family Zn-ribbon-containing protein [Microbulbifer sp. JMSA004]|uniref:DUF2310 family Zn-ribbon-containing protein n=1 Tax=Microbulbifer sp. JMSA004 TaxID=3243370 RepID=UPI00403A5535
MYTISLNFKVTDTFETESQMDIVNSLLGAWRMNGQILGDQFPTAKTELGYLVYVNTPECDSISAENQNKYVKKYTDALTDVGLSKPEVVIVGKEPECKDACTCLSTDFYILYTTYVTLETPLRCGHCFSPVPLYQIPKTYDDEYYNIIRWQSDYQSCDSLQMNCTVGERFASNQMGRLESPLSRMGLEVSESISSKTGKPVYYYLYKGAGKSYKIEASRKCPKCNGAWAQSEPLHEIFDFMCGECKLLSNIAWNVQ